MKNYGLTNWQIKKAHEKILKNKEFLHLYLYRYASWGDYSS